MKPSRGSLILRSSISATIWVIRSASRRALAGSISVHSPSSLNSRCLAASNSMPGRAATYRSHASSISTACAAVEVTTATPGNFLCTSAISGLTSDRFCFSERTSPSRTSSVSAPTYMPAPCHARSGPRLLPHLERLDHIADLDVAVADPDTALEALADLGGVVFEPAQRLDREAVGNHDAVPDQASP